MADDVAIRIVIQDDGKVPPAQANAPQTSPAVQTAAKESPYAQAAQYAQSVPVGVIPQRTSGIGPAKIPSVTKAIEEDDPVGEIAGAVARAVGIDNRLLKAALAARDMFKEKPPVAEIVKPALPEVMARPVNAPAGPPPMPIGGADAPAAAGASAGAVAGVSSIAGAVAGVSSIAGAVAGVSSIAGAVAIAVGAIAALTYAFTKATQHFIERGRELEKYSPQLAGAGARQNIRDVQTDLREAQALGGSYAALSDQWGELKMMLNEMFLPFKQAVVDGLTFGVRLFTDMIELVRPFIDLAGGVLTTLGKILNAIYKPLLEALEAAIKIRDKLLGKEKADLPDPILQFFTDANNQNGRVQNRQVDPLKKAADQRLNIPAFAGI